MVNWIACDGAQVVIVPADIAAIMEEVDSKPGLGIEDSAGLVDWDEEDAIENDYEWIRWGC